MYKILAKLSFRANNLHYLPSCHSTNEIAQNLVKSGTMDGTVVITDDQFAGKGQTGNSWQSETGQNLTFSLVLKPTFLNPNKQFLITIAISLALKSMLEEHLPGEVKVKLRPLPAKYAYRYVNGEVLVVAEAARKVIDAVVLLSTL